MKPQSVLAFVIVLLMFASFSSFSQHVLISPGIEKTIAGAKYSGVVAFETGKQWRLGCFYETEINKTAESMVMMKKAYGGIVYLPLVRSERLIFYFNTRVGVVDKNFLVVIPALETQIIFSKNLSMAPGLGFRYQQPSASLRLNFKL